MTLDARNGGAVERTGNSLSSDLRSVLTGTSRMFELFTSTFAVMKDRIGARRKVVDSQLNESEALAQNPSDSSSLSVLGAGSFARANSLLERSPPAPASKGKKSNPATRSSINHIGARIGAKARSAVVSIGTNQSSEQLVPSFNDGTFSSSQSTASGKGDDGYEVSGNGTTFDEPVAKLESKLTDVRMSEEEHLAVSLNGVKGWNVRANPAIMRSVNPIRRITDTLVLNKENGKNLISLAVGDPALFGPHMKVPDVANSAVIDVVRDGRYNGYTLSSGLLEARRYLSLIL